MCELEGRLAQAQWKPITAENLPKIGDELLSVWTDGVMDVEVVRKALPTTFEEWKEFTTGSKAYYRPINPPKSSKDAER